MLRTRTTQLPFFKYVLLIALIRDDLPVFGRPHTSNVYGEAGS